MYSMLLMTAMASGPEVTEFNGFFRRLLFPDAGCVGSCVGSRFASGCSGSRFASPAYGSCTGRLSAGLGSCTGRAYSSCTGSGYTSCCGGSYYASCSGGGMVPSYSAPMMTPLVYSPPPTFEGCCGPATPTFGSGAPFGGNSPGFTEPPLDAPLAIPRPAAPPPIISETQSLQRVGYVTATPDRATVTVRLPVEAVLYAQGRRLTLTGGVREFVTPPLPPGEFQYSFRSEYIRGGEIVSRVKQIAVQRGQTSLVTFWDDEAPAAPVVAPVVAPAAAPAPAVPMVPAPPGSSADVTSHPSAVRPIPAVAKSVAPTSPPAPTPAAAASARIAVRVPAGAVLYVDGRKHERTESVRRFETPPIPPGETFTYALRVDMPAGGPGPVAQSDKVTVRGGESTTVDFTTVPGSLASR